MTQQLIQTVTGPIAAQELGRTLMHEHLVIGFPGWESDTFHRGPTLEERFSICVDRIEEMKDLGFKSMLDPCPNDLGRDVELMAKVAQKTGFQIVCATGLYKHTEGGQAYWQLMGNFGPSVEVMAEMFIRELTQDIAGTGIRAGIIKVGTGVGSMTDYERIVFEAAARASAETGAPITTHTDEGTLGDEQQKLLTELGVPARRIIIGHSCGSADHDYHMGIACGGSYLGFDRFGVEFMQPDAERVSSLVRLIEKGAGDRVIVSHDSVWCMRGVPIPAEVLREMETVWNPSHFSLRITPMLLDAGITNEQIDRLLIDNPANFFAGNNLPQLSR